MPLFHPAYICKIIISYNKKIFYVFNKRNIGQIIMKDNNIFKKKNKICNLYVIPSMKKVTCGICEMTFSHEI